MKREYLRRIVDDELDILMQTSGAVLIVGPKWCGKTRTAEERAASTLFLQDIDEEGNISKTLDIKPSRLLEGDEPRLIDEWQTAPKLWNGIRHEVDRRGGPGHFLLTGSAVPRDTEGLHSGTGRIVPLLMRPMTLFESLESNGAISLRSLFDGIDDVDAVSPLKLEDVAFALARGGWPESVGQSKPLALRYAINYVNTVMNSDISRADGVRKDPMRVERLMRSLARNTSSTANLETILADVAGDGDGNINSDNTIRSYLDALRSIYVVEDLPAWSPNMRSKTALRTSPKRHFVDPSIAVAVLGTSPDGLMDDFNTFGLLFESLCIRDLRVYAQAIDGQVYHYRDKEGLEADAIISLRNGRWAAIEMKMGGKEIDDAIANLKKLRERVDTEKMGNPSFMAVITAGKYASRTEDGIFIIPIGCLRH